MDTRTKILSVNAALETALGLRQEGRALTVVTGYFDVLLAGHVRELLPLTGAGALMVVLLPAPDPLLPERARAELVAALHMVDYVVTAGEGGLDVLFSRLEADRVVHRQDADERQSRLLIEHVHRRHSV